MKPSKTQIEYFITISFPREENAKFKTYPTRRACHVRMKEVQTRITPIVLNTEIKCMSHQIHIQKQMLQGIKREFETKVYHMKYNSGAT